MKHNPVIVSCFIGMSHIKHKWLPLLGTSTVGDCKYPISEIDYSDNPPDINQLQIKMINMQTEFPYSESVSNFEIAMYYSQIMREYEKGEDGIIIVDGSRALREMFNTEHVPFVYVGPDSHMTFEKYEQEYNLAIRSYFDYDADKISVAMQYLKDNWDSITTAERYVLANQSTVPSVYNNFDEAVVAIIKLFRSGYISNERKSMNLDIFNMLNEDFTNLSIATVQEYLSKLTLLGFGNYKLSVDENSKIKVMPLSKFK